MSTTAVNGREVLFANLSADEAMLPRDGEAPTPATHTMFDPITVTLPSPPPTSPQLPPYQPVIDGDYVGDQWHFDFLGDIDAIWAEYTGSGVHVGVYDDGLMSSHPDLAGNYDASRQITVNGVLIDPNYAADWIGYPHGTAVAGLIASGDNGFGTKGVAYGASLTGITIFSGVADINSQYANFLQAMSQAGSFDVINNSWGKFPGFWQDPLAQEQDRQLIDVWTELVETARDGLGTIIVKAAGNDDRNANGDAAATSRASIVVGAYDDDNDASYYSSFGSNLLISAPSSGDNNRGLVTTDVGRTAGYNIWENNDGVMVEDDYTNNFGGTSGATPIVTAVVALMLEANPDLGWRDVQNILVYSAHEIGSGVGGERIWSEDHDWRYNNAGNWNGGGLHYSEDYGYGSVDAYNAVRMAEVWHLFGQAQASANETSYSSTATNIALPDTTTTDIQFTFNGSSFDVESVSIELVIQHLSQSVEQYLTTSGIGDLNAFRIATFLSDLDITLISPDGTETKLADFTRELVLESLDTGYNLVFNANAFRGEDGIGTWTIRINDPYFGDSGTVESAKLTLHGKDGDQVNLNDDVYHYTNEVFTTLDRDAGRLTLTDTNGGTDWVNLAAMSGNVVVRLGAGEASTGTSSTGVRDIFKIAAGAAIENAVAGDGNDTLVGNDLANKLYGMRGNDAIDGGAGADTLSGGAGFDTLTGGAGADNFLFDRALALTNVDIITDFSHIDDTIWLDSSIFSTLGLGALRADVFYVMGIGVEDAGDRIVYNAATGALFYDADGSGSLAALQFATLTGSPDDLSFNDFVVVTGATSPMAPAEDREATTPPEVVYTSVEHPIGDGTPIHGTDAPEKIRTKDEDDTIYGNGGVDYIYSGAGNDYIDGGLGYDILSGGEGDDYIIGGGSHPRWGDSIFGDAGNDILLGSDDQPTNPIFYGDRGDVIHGGDGDDWIRGFSGDDLLVGGAGNDTIYGDSGYDSIAGDEGDDLIYAGTGQNHVDGGEGFDTLFFDGNMEDFRFFFVGTNFRGDPSEGSLWVERVGATGEDKEVTGVNWGDVELLQFADQSFSLEEPIIVERFGAPWGSDRPEVEIVADGYQMGAYVDGASTVSIFDQGTETGSVDRMQAINIGHVYGDVKIRSDAVSFLSLSGLGHADWNNLGQFVYEPYEATLEVFAAAGERTLDIDLNTDLGANGLIADRTATSVHLSSDLNFIQHLNGAEADGYNLAFDSATTIRFKDMGDSNIQWYVPNATRIEIFYEQFEDPAHLTRAGNSGIIEIETALDDKLLATAGGSAQYIFDADILTPDYYNPDDPSQAHASQGVERVRFGNLGKVNASNDGTTGEAAEANAGLGLRGKIELGAGSDEVRILGSGAFKGGTVDAGSGAGISWEKGEADVLRMTFGVADAIGNISSYISNFEVLQLDTPTQAQTQTHGRWGSSWSPVKTNTVDVRNFDSLKRIDITGSTAEKGDSRIVNIQTDSVVKFRTAGDPRIIQNVQNEIFSTYDKYGNNFGKVRLDMAGSGRSDVLTLAFVGLLADGLDTGTITVADAETVKITTDSLDQDIYVWNKDWFFPEPMSAEPTDPFAQALALEATKTVILSGDTGWDFTVAGSNIRNVTRLDASGVTTSGAVGAVKAVAQARDVTLIGGAGDDALTGAWGDDILVGGDGNDVLKGEGGDDIIEGSIGDDVMDGGIGKDTASYANAAGPVTVSLAIFGPQDTGIGNDTLRNFENLKGSAFDDWLTGDRYDNVLDGGIGADDMTGGKGDDTYIVDDVNDIIHEAANQGTDSARSSVSFTLAANVENLYLTGSNAIDGTGNDLANKIIGNAAGNKLYGLGGDDFLYGGAAADKLFGGAGNDWLKGGGGADAFVFNTALSSKNNRDVIDDYRVSDDTIWLDNAIFTALTGAEGASLSADQFWKGAGAHDASDRIIYNPWTGTLTYDSNGSAKGGEIEIAILSKGLAMTHEEFLIV